MQNITKKFYEEESWKSILTEAGYNLGGRELQSLIYFLQEHAEELNIENIIHLGIGGTREIPVFLNAFSNIRNYLLVDICLSVLDNAFDEIRAVFPRINFLKALRDVETPDFLSELRSMVGIKPTLVTIVGNGVIFSNRSVEHSIKNGMQKDDLFLLTTETPHEGMFSPYDAAAVYELISHGGIRATKDNTKIIYDETAQCLKMITDGECRLASYKPTAVQLRERMARSGFTEVFLKKYPDIHMLGSLWKK